MNVTGITTDLPVSDLDAVRGSSHLGRPGPPYEDLAGHRLRSDSPDSFEGPG